ncbi:MAG: hypothetical protein R3F65_33850 [bacterium]
MTDALEPTYAPLLEADVPCPTLDVYELDGTDWRPAYDHEESIIELLATDTARDLSERIVRPGRYRVVARDPRTKRILTRKDHNLRPSRRGRGADAPSFQVVALYQKQTADALAAKQAAETALADERRRLDDQLREERRHGAQVADLLREQADDARKRAHDIEVRMAGLMSRLEAREERLEQLEAQLAEMKAEVANAQQLTAELKKKADDAEFSPLEAIMQMDQALEVLGKTAERFGRK